MAQVQSGCDLLSQKECLRWDTIVPAVADVPMKHRLCSREIITEVRSEGLRVEREDARFGLFSQPLQVGRNLSQLFVTL